jgi:hypothetical protein
MKLACWCGTWPTPSGTLTGAVIQVTGRHQHRDARADRFVSRIPVKALGGSVPERDAPVEGHRHDGILGRFDYIGQVAGVTFGGPALRDIANRRTVQPPAGHVQRGQADLDRKLAAVFAQAG